MCLLAVSAFSADTSIYGYGWHPVTNTATFLSKMVDCYPTNVIASDTPANIATRLNALPAGKRVLLLLAWETTYGLASGTQNSLDKTSNALGQATGYASPWFTNATANLKAAVSNLMAGVVANGATVDRVDFDFEAFLTSWSISTFAHYRAIIADPRYPTFAADMGPFSIADADIRSRRMFDAVMSKYVADAMREGEFDVVKGYFPNVKGSSYAHTIMATNDYEVDVNNQPQFGFATPGTDNTWPFYGWMAQINDFPQPGITTNLARTPYNAILWSIKAARSMRRSSTADLVPWIGYKAWTTDNVGPVVIGTTPYYEEMIYHLALNGAKCYLYFNPRSPYGTATFADDIALDNCLTNLAYRGVTTAGTTENTNDIFWNSRVVASGMNTSGDTVIWRITVPEAGNDVSVLVDGSVTETLNVPDADVGVWYTNTHGANVTFQLTTDPVGNAPPTVSIVAPATSAPGGNISPAPTATASDSDGTIATVGFFYNGDFSPTFDTAVPYQSFRTYNYQGPLILTVVAQDNLGAVAIVKTNITITSDVPVLTTTAASQVMINTATVGGNITSIKGTSPIFRGIEYGTTVSYGNTTTNAGIYIAGAFTENLSGLLPGTTYHYRPYAQNAVGVGYGSDQTFSTIPYGNSRSGNLRVGNLKGR